MNVAKGVNFTYSHPRKAVVITWHVGGVRKSHGSNPFAVYTCQVTFCTPYTSFTLCYVSHTSVKLGENRNHTSKSLMRAAGSFEPHSQRQRTDAATLCTYSHQAGCDWSLERESTIATSTFPVDRIGLLTPECQFRITRVGVGGGSGRTRHLLSVSIDK